MRHTSVCVVSLVSMRISNFCLCVQIYDAHQMLFIRTNIRTQTYTHLHTHTCKHTCMHTCKHTHHAYIGMYIHAHMYSDVLSWLALSDAEFTPLEYTVPHRSVSASSYECAQKPILYAYACTRTLYACVRVCMYITDISMCVMYVFVDCARECVCMRTKDAYTYILYYIIHLEDTQHVQHNEKSYLPRALSCQRRDITRKVLPDITHARC
jgi:hypothetical protein